MAKQLIVSVNGREKKIAIIEDDKVTEFYIERGEQHQGIVGNIYTGLVMRVLPGMQSAFVDIGLERDAFLYVSDFFDEEEEFERIVIDKAKKGTPDAEHAAAEELALNRVEREQRTAAGREPNASDLRGSSHDDGLSRGRRRTPGGRRNRRRDLVRPRLQAVGSPSVTDTLLAAIDRDCRVVRRLDDERADGPNRTHDRILRRDSSRRRRGHRW
jgi:ribonuclease G